MTIEGKEPKKAAKIEKQKGSELTKESQFCIQADFLSRGFGSFLYAVDANLGNLHVFS